MDDDLLRRWDPVRGVWPREDWPVALLAGTDGQNTQDVIVGACRLYVERTGYFPRELWLTRQAEARLAARAELLHPGCLVGRSFRDLCPHYAGLEVRWDAEFVKVKSRFAVAAGKDRD